jgi:hypothetical protein
MSLTISSRDRRTHVRIGGELDKGGRQGLVLLAVKPSPALLTRGEARSVARALGRFADSARPLPRKRK